jgi:hypothetical protein
MKHKIQKGKKEEQERINTNREAFSNWTIQKFTNLHPILQKQKPQKQNDFAIVIKKKHKMK